MTARRRPAALLALGGALALAPGAAAAAPAAPDAAPAVAALTIHTTPGLTDAVVADLGRGGLAVSRRQGATLQVVADLARLPALRRLPGVAGAHGASTAVPDQAERGGERPERRVIRSEGLMRTGATVLEGVGDGGAGLTIAVIDLGFGMRMAPLQATGELPTPDRLETASFDPIHGLTGRNAYGSRTNHGELVAQTVYDYAPDARYLFVNYHSPADFVAAVDWLVSRRPDIVVHSNSFIEGRFDGTGPEARAVDRAADAGILWFNSAGNYGQRHAAGPWVDANGDDVHEWPGGDLWTFERGARAPISFALSWRDGEGGATDLDLVLERLDGGAWTPVSRSADRQGEGAPPAERITAYTPPAPGTFRLRVERHSGPEPTGDMTLFSREIALAAAGGSPDSSIPTPGDARGSITVGAVDWRGDRLKGYSSQGPTDDGRLKPELVAPTDTRVVNAQGRPRRVGGTSNAAPNAAGAAALALAAARRSGARTGRASVTAELQRLALDLGPPGPDTTYGHGRVRVDSGAPRIIATTPDPLASVRGSVPIRFRALDRAPIAQSVLRLDGRRLRIVRGRDRIAVRINTRRLDDGFHLLEAETRDLPGNRSVRQWTIKVDNTRPELRVQPVEVAPPPAPARPAPRAGRGPGAGERGDGARRRERPRPPRPRPAFVTVAARDPDSTGRMELRIRLERRGELVGRVRTRSIGPTEGRRIGLGRLAQGRYRLRLELRDRAGNPRVVTKGFLVSGAARPAPRTPAPVTPAPPPVPVIPPPTAPVG